MMSNKPAKKAAGTSKTDDLNVDDLRSSVMYSEFSAGDVREVADREVNEGKIFGLAPGERMILSVILFLAVSVLSVALLFATGTIVLP